MESPFNGGYAIVSGDRSRNRAKDPSPSSNRPWAPPNLPKYEAELGGRIGRQ